MTDGEVEGDGNARRIERPTAAAAASAIERALGRGSVVSVVGECEVDGPPGDRVAPGNRQVLLKPDGAVVLHGASGTGPVTSRSGSDTPDVTATDGTLVVATRGDSGGPLRFRRVDLLTCARLDDVGEDRPGPERDRHGELRERLVAEPDLVEPGFRPRSTERETAAGPVDLFGRDAEGRAVVVEVKAHRAGPAAVGQLDRYVEALRRDLHAGTEVRGILAAPSATERARRLLVERGFEFRALPSMA